jgi:hypothetical protein
MRRRADTRISYAQAGASRTARIAAAGTFHGQVTQRQWTVSFLAATAPTSVTINGKAAPASAWTWDAAARTVTVTTPVQSVPRALTIGYR